MTAKSESRSMVIVLRSQLWILRIQENDFSASALSIDKTVRTFRSSLSFGKKMLSACCLSVRRPRWIHNRTRFLSLPAHSSWLSKDDGKASDGPTSHAVLEQVPSTDLGWILTDFLNERRRRKLIGGSGGMIPRYIFFDFNSLKFPFLGFWVIQIGYLQGYNLDFFPFKIYLFIHEKSDPFSWKVGNRCRYAFEFYCGFLKRPHYLKNKSTELGHDVPSFPEQFTSRKGIVTVSFQYCAADYARYVVFSISLRPTYFRMSFHVLILFWWAVLKGGG